MPLTTKGEKILKAMRRHYGYDQGERVFYASANKGRITGVHGDGQGGGGPLRSSLRRVGQTFLESGMTPQQKNQEILNYMGRRGDEIKEVAHPNDWLDKFMTYTTEEMGQSDIGNADVLVPPTWSNNFEDLPARAPRVVGKSLKIGNQEIKNSDLGNFFVGVNAQRNNIPLNLVKPLSTVWTAGANIAETAAPLIAPGTKGRQTGWFWDDPKDWKLYDAGAAMVKAKPDGNYTIEDIVKYLVPVLQERYKKSRYLFR